MNVRSFAAGVCLLAGYHTLLEAQVDTSVFDRLEWRNIGPANMGGRTADIEGVPGNPNIVYAATASGGLWKTVNGGVTWTPIFERQGTFSLGDIALEPGNPDVIWAGTGESNVRNSVSFGDGVYKSTDGGKNWRHVGLKDSERISRIVVHPRDRDTVYVGALGHAFGPHPERGVFMTTDGAKTWQKTLYIDPSHGVSDMDIDPANPNILYAAMWRFERKPWTHTSGSEQGGVFRSIDGGRTWKKLTDGLPKLMGRIGVKVAPSNPNVVYVIAESNDGTLFRSDDRGEKFRQVSKNRDIVSRGFYYTDMRVDPLNENRIYAVASTLYVSIDGGNAFKRLSPKTHIDYHALWIDPQDPRRIWQGQDGGIAVSYDQGENWEYVNNMPLAQFYQLHADNRLPFYNVMGGLQDNGSWSGPSRTREPAGILNDDWRMVSFGDGFHVVNHPDDPDLYLTESQGGNILRMDLRTREQQSISPQPRNNAGGAASELKYRFNWNTPVTPSPHDKNTVYFGGNVLFRTQDFGRTWKAISPDLTTNDPEKQKSAGGPLWYDNSTAENHCTIISVTESPVRRGTIWAGTDDGNLQKTTDGGDSWANVIRNVTGIPPHSPVSHVEASRTSADVAYAAFDRHMFDDFRGYVFKTTDGGKTWASISANLPAGAYVHVLREDPKNPHLLYAGTELGLFVSWDGGANWSRLGMKNLPHVAVHEIVVHPRENDLILATHGRSVLIFDDAAAVRQMTPAIAARSAHLFDPRPAVRFTTRFTRYGIGDKVYGGPNPPYGALLTYYLKDKLDEKAALKVEIFDAGGKLVRVVDRLSREKGVQRVAWDLRHEPPVLRRPPSEDETAIGGGPRGPQALPGLYTVKLTAGEQTLQTKVEVRLDPTLSVPAADLAEQFDHTLKLRNMVSATTRALKSIDSLKEQLRHIEKTSGDRVPEVTKEVGALVVGGVKELNALEARLAKPPDVPRLETGPRLAENLAALLAGIDGVNAAPTPYQKEYFNELQTQFRQRMGEVNAFLTRTPAQWNESLRKLGLPAVVAGKAIEQN